MEISILNIDNLTSEHVKKVSEKLPSRYQKSLKYRFQKDYKLSIGASFLMINSFVNICDTDIYYNQFEKPFLKNNDNFNISHSNNYVVFVKSKNIVGIDIEQISKIDKEVCEKVFQSSEIEWLNQDFSPRFYTLWTQKESVMKASGLGFSLDPKTFNVLNFQNNKPIIINNITLYSKTIFYKNYAISVCSDYQFEKIEVNEVS